MLERKDRNADRGKAEELGGPGSATGGQYLGRAGKTELEVEKSWIDWDSQQGYIADDNGGSDDENG